MRKLTVLIISFSFLVTLFLSVVANRYMEFSLFTRIISAIVVLELMIIAIAYLYDILCPREGIVYYKRMEYIANDTTHATYKIKIKRKFLGYPFIRVCRVSREVFNSLTFGDTYNCTTGKIIITIR